MKRKGKKSPKKGGEKKWFHPDLNRGPSLRQSDVITNYTMKPSTRVAKSLSHEEVKKKEKWRETSSESEEKKGSRVRKKWFHPESNWGPENQNLICCPYTMEPLTKILLDNYLL